HIELRLDRAQPYRGRYQPRHKTRRGLREKPFVKPGFAARVVELYPQRSSRRCSIPSWTDLVVQNFRARYSTTKGERQPFVGEMLRCRRDVPNRAGARIGDSLCGDVVSDPAGQRGPCQASPHGSYRGARASSWSTSARNRANSSPSAGLAWAATG